MLLGVHVSIAGKIYESLDRAKALGCTAMQIFSSNPRGWAFQKIDKNDVEEFKLRRALYNINPVVVHIPYLVNLASPDEVIYKKSIKAFIEDIGRSDELGGDYFITHLGSHKGKGIENGIKRFSDALNLILEKTKPKITVLLENTAGSGNSIGFKFEHIRGILDRVRKKFSIGVCLDTAHTYEAGYDIKTKTGLKETLNDFDNIIGIEKLKVIHLNDSMSERGSNVDRHENIGFGAIGRVGFKAILHNKNLRNLPFILETPVRKPGDDKRNLQLVRRLYR